MLVVQYLVSLECLRVKAEQLHDVLHLETRNLFWFFAGGFKCELAKNNQPNNFLRISPRKTSLARERGENWIILL